MGKKVKLNKNDLKNTLSTMKKVKPPKTVLVNNLTDFWPVLNDQQTKEFEEILKSFVDDKSNMQDMTIGLESTLRAIKNTAVKILLIAEEISPQWFGKHVISMCLTKDPTTKILILPKMKDITKKILDVSSIICGIKKEVKSFNDFYKNLGIHEELLNKYYTVRPNENVSIPKKKKELKNDSDVPPIVYLKKTPSDSVPVFSTSSKQEKMEFEESADFISLAKYDDKDLQKKSPFPAYRPLKVKKIVGNLNRKSKNL